MIVLVHGPDAATARSEVSRLLQMHDPADAATTRLDGRTVSIAQAAAMVSTPGFFGEARVVVIDDLVARATKGKAGADDRTGDEEAATAKLDLAPLLNAVLPENVLILIDTTLSSIPAVIRKSAPSDTRFVAGEPPRGKPLLDALQRVATDAGSELSATIAKQLAELLFPRTWATKPSNPRYDRPPDVELLRNEVEKLSLAAHPGPIESRHLQEMTDAASVDRLFPFLESAVGGSVSRAAAELRSLYDAGEDGHRLTAQLYQQVELAAVQEAAGNLVDPVEVGRAMGLPNPNRMIGIARARRSITAAAAIEQARAFDRKAKTGELRDPMDVLYGLITALAEPTSSSTKRRSG